MKNIIKICISLTLLGISCNIDNPSSPNSVTSDEHNIPKINILVESLNYTQYLRDYSGIYNLNPDLEYSRKYVYMIKNDHNFNQYIDSILSPKKTQYYINKNKIKSLDSILYLIRKNEIISNSGCSSYYVVPESDVVEFNSKRWKRILDTAKIYHEEQRIFPNEAHFVQHTLFFNLLDSLNNLKQHSREILLMPYDTIPPAPIYKFKILINDTVLIEKELINKYYFSILCR